MEVQEMDRQIVRKVIDDALAAGHTLSVFDGEEETVTNSSDAEQVFGAMFSTDDDYLYVLKDGKKIGHVRFVYGECGWDVIQDYVMTLDDLLKGAMALSDDLEKSSG